MFSCSVSCNFSDSRGKFTLCCFHYPHAGMSTVNLIIPLAAPVGKIVYVESDKNLICSLTARICELAHYVRSNFSAR